MRPVEHLPPPIGAALEAAPAWRREPYRVFFPLGLLLAWGGVLHWLLHAAGLLENYRPVFHAMAQIQGFMTCFAIGFLFTAIPRRTQTTPPAAIEMLLGAGLPVGTTIAAWFERWPLSQVFWLGLFVLMLSFVIRRIRAGAGGRRPPNSFVWIPIGLGFGGVGSLMTSGIALGEQYLWLHDLGQRFVLQGMFLGLIAGVGGMVVPLLTRGDSPPDNGRGAHDRLARAAHLGAAAILVLSFWIEVWVSLRWGYGVRAAVLIALAVGSTRAFRLPNLAGWHRWLVWLSVWMLPLGYLLAAIAPAQKKAGLHVVFIGGFALMAFSVGLHVSLAHGGHRSLVSGRPWQVPVFGFLMLAAASMRALVDFDQQRFFLWIGLSAAAFLVGSVFWALLVLPRLGEKAA
ncbi:MAG: NnrS family protein [bacterium]|nr:NnrS family protein [bacterium]